MPTYYVGPGGNDGNSGLTWALRKLTLNGAEDVPVVAGDTVYVAPGVYRETLTVDVSGGAGTEIVYIGDITGEHTDGVGGIVRITGSNNDTTATRTRCIDGTGGFDYRTFRQFRCDLASQDAIIGTDCTNWIVEDCILDTLASTVAGIRIQGANQADWTVRRCRTSGYYNGGPSVLITHSATVDDAGHLIEDCVFMAGIGVNDYRVGGVIMQNCSIINSYMGARVNAALSVGQTFTVRNCIIYGNQFGVYATVLGELVENYNSFFANGTDRTNVAVGGNSNSYPPLLDLSLLHAGAGQVSGFALPQHRFGELTTWSQVRAIADGGTYATLDLTGLTRPVTDGKRSWGACQYDNVVRDTGTVYSGPSSLELSDYGRTQFYVPVTGVQITVSIQVYLEANYAGNAPQMICKQPGQADRATTATGATGAWEELTDTFTPAADPEWIVVELVSRNTAAAGNYAVYFDALTVT